MQVTYLMATFMIWLLVLGSASSLKAEDTNAPVSTSEADTLTVDTNAFNVLDDKYHLAIGDQLSFRIVEDEDDPKILTVTDSGDIQVPYIGSFPAAGKTCKELALALKPELEKEYYRQATVIIVVDSKPRSRGKIYLVGAIHAPGPQDISSDEELTVSRAILRAGSFTDFADEKNVRITRGSGSGPDGKKTFTVNVARIFEKGDTEGDLPLEPGDLIFVPERMIRF
jgi:protein involved in polysaccharide export with SLBB domain